MRYFIALFSLIVAGCGNPPAGLSDTGTAERFGGGPPTSVQATSNFRRIPNIPLEGNARAKELVRRVAPYPGQLDTNLHGLLDQTHAAYQQALSRYQGDYGLLLWFLTRLSYHGPDVAVWRYVRNFYFHLLCRTPEEWEIQYWLAQADATSRDAARRTGIAIGWQILQSLEFEDLKAGRLPIQRTQTCVFVPST